jgi:hypothetical protein
MMRFSAPWFELYRPIDIRQMTRRFKNYIRVGLLSLVLLSLSVRVLIPAGYMPGDLSSGGPFVICPDGLFNFQADLAKDQPGEGEHAHHGHHSKDGGSPAPIPAVEHNHEEATGHTGYGLEFCPIGAVLGAAVAPAFNAPLLIAYQAATVRATDQPSVVFSLSTSLYLARGPPRVTPFIS